MFRFDKRYFYRKWVQLKEQIIFLNTTKRNHYNGDFPGNNKNLASYECWVLITQSWVNIS